MKEQNPSPEKYGKEESYGDKLKRESLESIDQWIAYLEAAKNEIENIDSYTYGSIEQKMNKLRVWMREH